jgi:hypothetical protein
MGFSALVSGSISLMGGAQSHDAVRAFLGEAVRTVAQPVPALDGGPPLELIPGCEADFLWDSQLTAPSSGLVRWAFSGRPDRWLGTEPGLHSVTLDYSPLETSPARPAMR